MAKAFMSVRLLRTMSRLPRPALSAAASSSLLSSASRLPAVLSPCSPLSSRHSVGARAYVQGSSSLLFLRRGSHVIAPSALRKLVSSSSSSSRNGSGWHDESEWIKDKLRALLPLLPLAAVGTYASSLHSSSRESLCDASDSQQHAVVQKSSELKERLDLIVEEVQRLVVWLWNFAMGMTQEASAFLRMKMDELRQNFFPQVERTLSQLDDLRKSVMASDAVATAQHYFDAGRKAFADNIGCFGRTDMHKSMAAILTRYVDELVDGSMKVADQINGLVQKGINNGLNLSFVPVLFHSPKEEEPKKAEAPPPKPASSIPPEIATKMAQDQSYLSKYGHWIIMASIVGGVIGFLVSRRFLERESSRIAAKSSEEAADAIREALYILKANSEVKASLGESLKEGRMNVVSGGKVSLNGQIAVKGEKGHGTLTLEAAKTEFGSSIHCTKLTLKLANGTEIPIPLANEESS
ncbi:hypothetical protein GUITHDRAFT_161746 [Guillardia theta CCMP2712]|uniref:Uncharacterized protein n=1 Tax=Guillardia theta (strain CCMP2712) TaxID=905079 RepID=L1JRV4_GUITC|nr:hypothetical protein GUITHDRAFT_161746 [Guillardia theta CCMP2712]EKX50915.1 hypothetical protein GUITHDRAFT_161746 [Guillardia theta CCMP2712]|eukprot:XP_005837895.1 hypothetical protein GUITHDRAFT_161746 [Guillardia theta CCMP2712]